MARLLALLGTLIATLVATVVSVAAPSPGDTGWTASAENYTIPLGGTGWMATAAAVADNVGKQYRFICPAGGKAAPIWGASVYRATSSVCSAAVHAGLITFATGGTVTIQITVHNGPYSVTPRFGVTPRLLHAEDCPCCCQKAFKFVGVTPAK